MYAKNVEVMAITCQKSEGQLCRVAVRIAEAVRG